MLGSSFHWLRTFLCEYVKLPHRIRHGKCGRKQVSKAAKRKRGILYAVFASQTLEQAKRSLFSSLLRPMLLIISAMLSTRMLGKQRDRERELFLDTKSTAVNSGYVPTTPLRINVRRRCISCHIICRMYSEADGSGLNELDCVCGAIKEMCGDRHDMQKGYLYTLLHMVSPCGMHSVKTMRKALIMMMLVQQSQQV